MAINKLNTVLVVLAVGTGGVGIWLLVKHLKQKKTASNGVLPIGSSAIPSTVNTDHGVDETAFEAVDNYGPVANNTTTTTTTTAITPAVSNTGNNYSNQGTPIQTQPPVATIPATVTPPASTIDEFISDNPAPPTDIVMVGGVPMILAAAATPKTYSVDTVQNYGTIRIAPAPTAKIVQGDSLTFSTPASIGKVTVSVARVDANNIMWVTPVGSIASGVWTKVPISLNGNPI